MIGIIGGSGFYGMDHIHGAKEEVIETKYGNCHVILGKMEGQNVAFISRHKKGHKLLSNMINHRANMLALKKLAAECVLSTTVGGILNPNVPLGQLLIFKDIFFPDNRLPNGDLCTIYTEENDRKRGHYLFSSPLNKQMICKLREQNEDPRHDVTYAHVNGPRFNTMSEVSWYKDHADVISQTAGPEVILAGELEIPIALIGCGVDFANGVMEKPTPPETIVENLEASAKIFKQVIHRFVKEYERPDFEGYVYRFE